jgi:hypothetical protein
LPHELQSIHNQWLGRDAGGSVCGKELAVSISMQTPCCAIVADGDETLIAMPESKTVAFYQYLRGFGICFTVHSRGFCEDNVFSFPESENMERLTAIVAKFPFH